MADLIIVAEFRFLVNKSFLGTGHRITVPARYHQALKEHALIDVAKAKIIFWKEPMEGSIRVGWRAGGRYYQITMHKFQTTVGIGTINIGTKLMVRILKTSQSWLIEID